MFERNYSFFLHWLLSCRCVIFQKEYFESAKIGGHKQPLGGHAPPLPPRSDGTASASQVFSQNIFEK